ncbi:MAG: GC-type dockerin domain-anchored protein [Planctomycetota bacterium]
MPSKTAARRLAAAILGLAVVPAVAQTESIILDDFDADNSDELFGNQGLIAIVQSDDLPTLVADDSLLTPGDVGGVRYIDNQADINLVVGQYPNDAGGGVELELDFLALRIIGFEADFRDVSADFPFGFTIFDDGPSGTIERKVAVVDTTIPAGDSTFVTLFNDPEWIIESGFEFNEIGSVSYGLNINARSAGGAIDPVPAIDLKFTELRAIVACVADINRDAAVDGSDFFAWVAAFTNQDPVGDVNVDGSVDGSDFFAWVSAFGSGC